MKANITQDLKSHLTLITKVGEYYSNKLGLNDDLKSCVKYSCLCHDVGKAIDSFQSYITDDFLFIVDDCKNDFDGPYHHEISWLICQHFKSNLFDFKINKNDLREIVLNAIYWHHGQPIDKEFKFRGHSRDIINKITEDDFIKVRDFLSDLFSRELTDTFEDVADNVQVPKFFTNKEIQHNSKILTVRSILICADRFVSSLNEVDFDDLIQNFDKNIQKYDQTNFPKIEYVCPNHYDQERFKTQEQCAIESLNGKTVVSKSPAGFGKTLQGLIRNFNSGGKVYWVCPRNAVATSVYKSILQELNALNINISLELFLTGERKESFNAASEICSSRIIVTNFDNILNPFYKNNYANKSFDILNSDIIFDEFHEIVNDEAIFAMFCSLMYSRNVLQNSKTFLLSATPMNMDYIWNGGNPMISMPSDDSHFKSFHNKKYVINFIDEKSIPWDLERSLYKFNSIKNTQDNFIDDHICFHSNFSDSDFKNIFDSLYENFGKTCDKNYLKNVFSAPIIGASFDISFNNAVIFPESPEADIQVIGRVNRWGLEDTSTLYFVEPKDENKSNKCTIENRYDFNLTKDWYNDLKEQFQNKEFDLNELYEFYNKYNKKHKVNIKSYLDNELQASINSLSENYFPIKFPKNSVFENNNGKSLRNSGTQHNIVVRENGVWMNESFTLSWSEFQNRLNDSVDNHQQVQKLKKILKNGLDKISTFDYSLIIKRCSGKATKDLDRKLLYAWSKNPMSPYPIISWTYNKKTGLQK